MIVLQPENVSENLPAIEWIHGGGYITGMRAMVYMSMAKLIAEEYGSCFEMVQIPLFVLFPSVFHIK